VLATLFKRFIVFELIIAVVKGIIKGFEDATGQTLKFSDALAAIGDVFAVVGDIIAGVFSLIETVTDAITLAIGTIVEMVVYIFKDITGQSTDAQKRVVRHGLSHSLIQKARLLASPVKLRVYSTS